MAFDPVIVLIPLVAVIAPLAARALSVWVSVPIVVFELALGIVIGPSGLGWAHPTEFVDQLAELGLALLFFIAGTEIEAAALRGRTGRRAIGGWLVSMLVGTALAWFVTPGLGAVVIGIALSSTALGTLLPIIRDAGELRTPFGRAVGALGAVGEFGPLVAITVLLGARNPRVESLVLLLFVLIAGVAIWMALRLPQGRLHKMINATLHTSGQYGVRLLILILAVLVGLSMLLDIDILLGAFAAGIVWRLLMRDAAEADRHAVESKIDGLAFGFLVPVFFINTGVTFDLAALLATPVLLAAVPLVLVLLVLVRGGPSAWAAPEGSTGRDRVSVGLMGATGLPIIVAVTGIGVEEGLIPSAAASVLVGAGMLSVLLLPLIAMRLRGERVQLADTDMA